MTNVIFYADISLLENQTVIVYDVFMRDLIGKLFILFYCSFSLLFIPLNAEFVAGFFVTVICGCLLYLFKEHSFVFVVAGMFLILSLFFPILCVFYPVILYDFVGGRHWVFSAVMVVGFIYGLFPVNQKEFLFLSLGMGISAFLSYQLENQFRLEQTLIHTLDDSKEKNLLLSEKNQHLIERQNQEIYTATLKERNRIAREIHDNVGHMLSRSILLLGALKTMNQQENLDTSLNQLDDTLNLAMNNVRDSVHDLHDDSIDLHASVEELIAGFSKCHCQLDYDMGHFVPTKIKYTMISIVKEALANIIKHSNADLVRIRMREHPGIYQLIIEDNGTVSSDLDLSNIGVSGAKEGMGLLNMKDRIQALHGTLQIQTTHGFYIFITIPKGETYDSDCNH